MEQTAMFQSQNIKVDESQIVEPDICRNKHGGAETSVRADRRVQKAKDRRLVYGYVKSAGPYGMTLDELSIVLDRAPNCISGRFTELKRDGDVVATDFTRKTRTGSRARVYIAC